MLRIFPSLCMGLMALLSPFTAVAQNESRFTTESSTQGEQLNLNTGSLGLNIPLLNLTEGDISIPISLIYRGNGIKVNEPQGVLGTSWELKAGGTIHRNVNHLPDELPSGHTSGNFGDYVVDGQGNISFPIGGANLHTSNTGGWINNNFQPIQTSAFERSIRNDFLAKFVDLQPDNFRLDLPGVGGEFVLNKQGQPVKINASDTKIIPFINQPAANDQWRVVSENGHSYYFKSGGMNTPMAAVNPQGHAYQDTWSPNRNHYIGHFPLDRVLSNKGNQVSFSYLSYQKEVLGYSKSETNGCPTINMEQRNSDGTNTPMAPYSPDVAGSVGLDLLKVVSVTAVDEIVASNQVVRFHYRNVNDCLYPSISMAGQQKRLEKIELFSHGELVVEYTLHYSTSGSREFLREIKRKYAQEASSQILYQFNYNTSPMPVLNSSHHYQDDFGYYRYNSPGQFDLNQLKSGTLVSMVSPLGAETHYEYSPRAEGNIYAGGLVVSAITQKNKDGQAIRTTNYAYHDLKGYIVPQYPVVNGTTSTYSFPPDMRATSSIAQNEALSNGFFYGRVTVNETGQGKTEYHYIPNQRGTSFSGKLTSEKVFHENGQLLRQKDYTYELYETGLLSSTDIKSFVCKGCQGGTTPSITIYPSSGTVWSCGTPPIPVYFYKFDQVNIQYGWEVVSRFTEKTYDNQGQFVEKMTEYSFHQDGRHHKPTKVTSYGSDGAKHIALTTYPQDYNTAGLTDVFGRAIHEMNTRNIVEPLEVKYAVQRPGEQEKVIGGKLVEYYLGNNNQPLPKKLYRLELGTPISLASAPTLFVVNNQSMGRHAAYRKTKENIAFDSKYNLLESLEEDFVRRSFIYDGTGRYIIAGAQQASHHQIGFNSFEENSLQNWTWDPLNVEQRSGAAHSGGKCFKLTNDNPSPIQWVTSQPSGQMIVSFWAKSAAGGNLSINGQVFQQPLTSQWKYYETQLPSAASQVTLQIATQTGHVLLDDIKVFPKDVSLYAAIIDPVTQKTLALSDPNGVIQNFEHDNKLRNVAILDEDKSLLAKTEQTTFFENQDQLNVKRTWVFKETGISLSADLSTIPHDDYLESISYYDELGRSSQSILIDNETGYDWVSFNQYNTVGRQEKSYLAYRSPSTLGLQRPNPVAEQQAYYQQRYGSSTPFTQYQYESSPYGRIYESVAPGTEDWQINTSETQKSAFRTNQFNEVLMLSQGIQSARYFAANTIWVLEGQDEVGNRNWAYVDKLGRRVASKREIDANTQAWTYFLYDDFGRLHQQITPEGIKAMHQSQDFNPASSALIGYSYLYFRDAKGRMFEHKKPGAGAVLSVFDRTGRLVMSQDAEQRLRNEWNYAKINKFGQSVETGLAITNPSMTRNGLQTAFDMMPIPLFEERTATGYSDNSIPNGTLGITSKTALSQNFYGDYDLNLDGVRDANTVVVPHAGYGYVETKRLRGKLTVAKVKVLDASNTWLTRVYNYNDKGFLAGAKSDNHLGGSNTVHMDWKYPTGTLQKSIRIHQKTQSPTLAVEEKYEYDYFGRPKKLHHRIGQQVSGQFVFNDQVLLAHLTYDELGRMSQKNLHSENGGSNFLQSIDYSYNLRGWLKAINNIYEPCPTESQAPVGANGEFFKISYHENLINSGVVAEVDMEKEEVTSSGSVNTTIMSIFGQGLAVSTPTTAKEEVQVSMADQLLTKENIGLMLQTLEARTKEALTDEGVTNEDAKDMIAEKIQTLYKAQWLEQLRWREDKDDNCDLFSEALTYRANGTVGTQQWRMNGEANIPQYDFQYDRSNRMTMATYGEMANAPGSGTGTPTMVNLNRYNEQVAYDLNGSITSMMRTGMTGMDANNQPAYGVIDLLQYHYQGNQVQQVTDFAAIQDPSIADKGFKENLSSMGAVEYTYDQAGRLIHDANKGYSMQYNHLGLPVSVQMANGGTIQWLYDAAGNKLRKTETSQSGTATTKDYDGGIIYTNGQLESVGHAEGRCVPAGTLPGSTAVRFVYEYALKDHIGNVRAYFSDANRDGIVQTDRANPTQDELLQEMHYYPYGLPMEGTWNVQTGSHNPLTFNGVEFEASLGLNIMPYRTYDPATAQFLQLDPLADYMPSSSPYSFGFNNPVSFSDPSGLFPEGGDEDGVEPAEQPQLKSCMVVGSEPDDEKIAHIDMDKVLENLAGGDNKGDNGLLDEGFEPDGEDGSSRIQVKVSLKEKDYTVKVNEWDEGGGNVTERTYHSEGAPTDPDDGAIIDIQYNEKEVASIDYLFTASPDGNGGTKVTDDGNVPYPDQGRSKVQGDVTSIDPQDDGSTIVTIVTEFAGEDVQFGSITTPIWSSPPLTAKAGTGRSVVQIRFRAVGSEIKTEVIFRKNNINGIKVQEYQPTFWFEDWVIPWIPKEELSIEIDLFKLQD